MLGPKEAANFIKTQRQNPDMKAKDVISAKAIQYNPGVFGKGGEKTLGEIQGSIENRISKASKTTESITKGYLALDKKQNESKQQTVAQKPSTNVGINNTTNVIQQPDLQFFLSDLNLRQSVNMGIA